VRAQARTCGRRRPGGAGLAPCRATATTPPKAPSASRPRCVLVLVCVRACVRACACVLHVCVLCFACAVRARVTEHLRRVVRACARHNHGRRPSVDWKESRPKRVARIRAKARRAQQSSAVEDWSYSGRIFFFFHSARFPALSQDNEYYRDEFNGRFKRPPFAEPAEVRPKPLLLTTTSSPPPPVCLISLPPSHRYTAPLPVNHEGWVLVGA
jgi:hypothetical protein